MLSSAACSAAASLPCIAACSAAAFADALRVAEGRGGDEEA
jgi:hypothetical protein